MAEASVVRSKGAASLQRHPQTSVARTVVADVVRWKAAFAERKAPRCSASLMEEGHDASSKGAVAAPVANPAFASLTEVVIAVVPLAAPRLHYMALVSIAPPIAKVATKVAQLPGISQPPKRVSRHPLTEVALQVADDAGSGDLSALNG